MRVYCKLYCILQSSQTRREVEVVELVEVEVEVEVETREEGSKGHAHRSADQDCGGRREEGEKDRQGDRTKRNGL